MFTVKYRPIASSSHTRHPKESLKIHGASNIESTSSNSVDCFKLLRLSLTLLFAMLFLSACGDPDVTDLEAYTADIKSRKKGTVPPLPVAQPYETYAYNEKAVRDPFTAVAKLRKSRRNGVVPKKNRKRQVLEQFPLNTLHMVGSLEQNGQRWALIKGQDGTLYRTTKGRYIGQDNGQILRVTDSDIILQEIVPDGLGGWIKRKATLSVSE